MADVSVAEFIVPRDHRWQRALQKVEHDVYHLPEYVTFAAGHEGGEPAAFYAEQGEAFLLMPLLIRKLPDILDAPPRWRDATTPYGYPSPLLHPCGDAPALAGFLEAFIRAARQRELICAFFRCHPLIELPLRGFAPFGALVHHGPTVYMDLSQAQETLWRNVRNNHRRNINQLQKRGFEVRIDEWSDLPGFIAIYRETMSRLEANRFYFFRDEYFSDLRAHLGSKLHLASVLSPDGEMAAGGLFMESGGFIEYHLGGTSTKYLEDAPSKLLFDALWRWAKDRGNRIFHLGGGFGAQSDSLLRFKEGFSKLKAPFHTIRLVARQEDYAALVGRWRELGGNGAGHEDYFPRYRAPL